MTELLVSPEVVTVRPEELLAVTEAARTLPGLGIDTLGSTRDFHNDIVHIQTSANQNIGREWEEHVRVAATGAEDGAYTELISATPLTGGTNHQNIYYALQRMSDGVITEYNLDQQPNVNGNMMTRQWAVGANESTAIKFPVTEQEFNEQTSAAADELQIGLAQAAASNVIELATTQPVIEQVDRAA